MLHTQAMSSDAALTAHRHQWISCVCAGMVEWLGNQGVIAAASEDEDAGNHALLSALVVSRIAVLLAAGHRHDEVVSLLAAPEPHQALQRPLPNQLPNLIDQVGRQLARDGITASTRVDGCGLLPWSPESTFQLLLELWATQRRGAVGNPQTKKELQNWWGIDDTDWLQACLSRAASPFATFTDLLTRIGREPDEVVRNLVVLGLSSDDTKRRPSPGAAVERLSVDAYHAQHLLVIASELMDCRRVRQYVDQLSGPQTSATRRSISRVLEVLSIHTSELHDLISGLTGLEQGLVHEWSAVHTFQHGCLIALASWLGSPAWTTSLEVLGATHGTWGPLPWGTITVRAGDEERAAIATLAEGTLPLGVELDVNQPTNMILVCRRPRSTEPGLHARFTFDLTNPVHASELLSIGNRGEFCIDVLREHEDLDGKPTPCRLGTLRVGAYDEVAQFLTDIATRALRQLVPPGWQPYGNPDDPAPNDTVPWQCDAYYQDPWLSPRPILIANSDVTDDIRIEMTDPPTKIATIVNATRRIGTPNPRPENMPRTARHTNGFVYVQQNPAFPEILKIGFTNSLAEDRAADLSRTAVPFPYQVVHRSITEYPKEVEKAVLRTLTAQRVSPTEFFRVTPETAVEVIQHCQEKVTGIESWAPAPQRHLLRKGDHLVLPLKARQVFLVTAYPSLLAPHPDVIDIWQAHADGDILELHLTADPGDVHGFSDNDPNGAQEPVPFLSRDNSAPNGLLIGRERLAPGDRLSWMSDHHDPERCINVVFEMVDYCQVICRTWNPRSGPDGLPFVLDDVTRSVSPGLMLAAQQTIALGPPRTWAPRDGDENTVRNEKEPLGPEHWLPQLRPRRR